MRRIAMICALLLWAPLAEASPSTAPAAVQGHSHHTDVSYACPMHPDVTAPSPGSCTRCGMPLERLDPHKAAAAYRLELETSAGVIQPGRPFSLKLVVRAPGRDDVVKDFTVVHERRFHLFVISRDLLHYRHLHPTQDPNGAWVEDLTLPEAGEYRVYADVLPAGARPQLLVETLRVEGPAGASPQPATLEPDTGFERTLGDLRVRLTVPRGGLTAGGHQSLQFQFTHAETGAPIRDLQPYLGAWGHTVMVSEDMAHFVHAHPSEALVGKTGGPQLTFAASPPAPGTYRVWTQVMRDGAVETVVFTIKVHAPR
jgi:hypothetical protein